MNKIFKIIGVIAILVGLISILATDDIIIALFLLAVGAFLVFSKQKQTVREAAPTTAQNKPTPPPTKDIVTYSIYPAWSNKYPGLDSIIEDIKANNEPYDGYTTKELREHFENGGDTYYEYPQTEINNLDFIPEPDNKYNPEAVKIVSHQYGMIGYVPDKNLSRVKGILKKHPNAHIYLDVYGGNSKFWDDGEYGEKGKIITQKGDFKAKVRFEYERS